MKARLVAVGERAPSWVADGFAEYRKRLSHWLPLELVEIEPGLRGKGRDTARATADEGARVLAALPKSAHLVDTRCRRPRWSSEELAQRLQHWRNGRPRPGVRHRRSGRPRERGIAVADER